MPGLKGYNHFAVQGLTACHPFALPEITLLRPHVGRQNQREVRSYVPSSTGKCGHYTPCSTGKCDLTDRIQKREATEY